MPSLSIIIPVYCNAATLVECHRRIITALDDSDELQSVVFVDDASTDDSWQILVDIVATDQRVIALRLAQNVGQQSAIFAGIDASDGDLVAILDADLEDPPEALPTLLAEIELGHDCVIADRRKAGRPALRRIGSAAAGWLAGSTANGRVDVGSSFLIADRRLAKPVLASFRSTGVALLVPELIRLSRSSTTVRVSSTARDDSGYSAWALVLLGYRLLRSSPSRRAVNLRRGLAAAALGGCVLTANRHRRTRALIALLVLSGVAWCFRLTAAESTHEPLYRIRETAGSR